MSKNENHTLLDEMTNKNLGLVIGLVFGGLVGSLIGNPIIFAGGCMMLGFSIGSALDNRHR